MPSVCKYHQQINIQIACSFIECNLRDRALVVYYANRLHLHISSFLFNRMDVCRDCSYTIPIHHFIYVNNVFYTESKELLEISNSKLQWQFIWIEYSRGNILWFVWFYAAHTHCSIDIEFNRPQIQTRNQPHWWRSFWLLFRKYFSLASAWVLNLQSSLCQFHHQLVV